MLHGLRRFLRLDRTHRRLFLQAATELGRVRWALRRSPFKMLVADLERHGGAVDSPGPGNDARDQARQIGWAVRAASGAMPWESTCLVQVLAAQRLLAERLIPGAIYIGAAAGEGAGRDIDAHAWLMCGNDFITGQAGHQRYTVVATFVFD